MTALMLPKYNYLRKVVLFCILESKHTDILLQGNAKFKPYPIISMAISVLK